MIDVDAQVDPGAIVDESARVWGGTVVRPGAVIGDEVIIGRGVCFGAGVPVGARSKIQNLALIYEGSSIEVGVFVGPEVVLTNDEYPRAANTDGNVEIADDWALVSVRVREGATLGVRSVCIAPVTIGRWAEVATGSVLVHDVSDYALVAGTPARQIGVMGPAGFPLVPQGVDVYVCPRSGLRYQVIDKQLHPEIR